MFNSVDQFVGERYCVCMRDFLVGFGGDIVVDFDEISRELIGLVDRNLPSIGHIERQDFLLDGREMGEWLPSALGVIVPDPFHEIVPFPVDYAHSLQTLHHEHLALLAHKVSNDRFGSRARKFTSYCSELQAISILLTRDNLADSDANEMRKRGPRKNTFSVQMNKLQYGVVKSLLPQQYSLQLQHQISLQSIKEEEEGSRQPTTKIKVQKAEIFEEEDETKFSVNRVSPKTVKVTKQECKASKLKLKIKLKRQSKKSKGKSKGKDKAKNNGKNKGRKGRQGVQKSQEQTNEFEKQKWTSANKQERKEAVAQIRPMLTNDVVLEQDGRTVRVSQDMAEKVQSSLRRYIKYPYPYHLKTLRRVSQKIRVLSEEQRLQIFNDICMDHCSMVDLRELPVVRVLPMVDKIKKMLRQINRSFSESSNNSSGSYSESSFESTS